ncbi:MAG: type VI secretion system protein TssA [Lamprobacter sp.]|uniref:type VI secretion system protein TssA n=1 Tax=Lamprobacter sp. TaxID=3100796 RepID=UPI002B26154A|nr:type VI secretion system protein TssA [Lamprobacter sp.]MEA3640540.1 type VI secretion system protein TssA [Lamprobacter sp.]
MSNLPLSALLTPVSADAPAGEDLEYDPQFVALEEAMRSEPEQQFGETIVAATEEDWQSVKKLALELLPRSKDLRVVVYLVQALTHQEGLAGMQQGLALLRAMLEQFWDSLHPQLDPDDDLDPTARVNIIASLCDATRMLRAVETAPMLQVPGLGKITLRDLRIARGEFAPPEDEDEVFKLDSIEAAARDMDAEALNAVSEQVATALQDITAIEQGLTEKVGVAQAVSLASLSDILSDIDHFLRAQLAGGEADHVDSANASFDDVSGDAAPQGASAKRLSGEITSTADVTTALDKIITYYKRHEPSSPVPLLLERAKRLVSQDFMEILRDIAPDALSQAETVTGAKAPDADGEHY